MRRLALLPLLALVFACTDGTSLGLEEDLAQDVVARVGYGPRSYLYSAEGEWSFDVSQGLGDPVTPGDECALAGGTHRPETVFQGRSVPFGPFTQVNVLCTNWVVNFYAESVATYRNSDEIWFHHVYRAVPEEGYAMTIDWAVVGGTGRFEGAIGEGVANATWPDPTVFAGRVEESGWIRR